MSRKPRLGQNFLIDDAARCRIADALGDISQRTVVEIGPGHGAITDILAARAGRLLAIELDAGLAAELSFRYRGRDHIAIRQGDILKADLGLLLDRAGTADVVGNLPYYITSEILLHLFAAARGGLLRRAVLMMQREVAERLAAPPGTRAYGLLTTTAQLHARVETLFTLPPGAFDPPPEVHSTVVRLEFRPRFAELAVEPEGFSGFLREAFALKRKTLGNNLRHAGYDAQRIAAAWPGAMALQVRAEALSLDQLAMLYRALRDER